MASILSFYFLFWRTQTENYNELFDDSKQFLSKIEKLEEAVAQKGSQISMLQVSLEWFFKTGFLISCN